MRRVLDGVRPVIPPSMRGHGSSPLLSGLAQIMEQCWSSEPNDRPTFKQIVEHCRSLQKSLPPRHDKTNGHSKTKQHRQPQTSSRAKTNGSVQTPADLGTPAQTPAGASTSARNPSTTPRLDSETDTNDSIDTATPKATHGNRTSLTRSRKSSFPAETSSTVKLLPMSR